MAKTTALANSSELAALASKRATLLLDEIKHQSQPRRWPWQQKTIRDLINEGRTDLADLAAVRSARLAQAAAEQRDALLDAVQKQSQPRKWPWQQKTAYDRVAEQRAALAELTASRSAALASTIAEQRERLVNEARRQSSSRRFPWQEPTLRDKLETQRKTLVNEARRQSAPRRFPWQQPTLRDKFDNRAESLKGTFTDGLNTANDKFNETLPLVQNSTADVFSRVRDGSRSAAEQLQSALNTTPSKFEQATDTLKEGGFIVGRRLSETADSAAQSVKTAAMVPVDAVRGTVEAGQHAVSHSVAAGQRKVRRGVRLARVMMWALLIGAVVGIMLAPRAGEDTRRKLQELWDNLLELVAPTA